VSVEEAVAINTRAVFPAIARPQGQMLSAIPVSIQGRAAALARAAFTGLNPTGAGWRF